MRSGFHEASLATPKGSHEPEGPPNGEGRGNRPAARAGGERGKAYAPAATRTGSSNGLRPRPRIREDGKAFGRRRDPKGDRRGLGLEASPRRRRGFGRAGSAKGSGGGTSVPCLRPDGDRREAFGPLGDTRRIPNGASRPRSGIRGERRGLRPAARSASRPARDGLATQRRQSRLGQVGAGGDTGPHYDSGAAPLRVPELRVPFCRGGQSAGGLFGVRTKGTKGPTRTGAWRLSFQPGRSFQAASPPQPLVASDLCANNLPASGPRCLTRRKP
jgi:hypothetical protein